MVIKQTHVKENATPNRKPTRMIEATGLRLGHSTEQFSNQSLQLRQTTSIDRQEFSARTGAFEFEFGSFIKVPLNKARISGTA